MDLHTLCTEFGSKNVAEVMGMSERCLVDVRRGHTALTVDDLFELYRAFPQFDLLKTVTRLGEGREKKGVSRKQRNARKESANV